MSEEADDLRRIFEVWLSSERKARIARFFHENPGMVETVDGVARRLGVQPDTIAQDIDDHVRLGVLQQRELGGRRVVMVDPQRRGEVEELIERLARHQEELL